MSQTSFATDPEWIVGRIQTLLGHYFRTNDPIDLGDAILADWCDMLRPYTQASIDMACKTWLFDHPRTRPGPGDIAKLASKSDHAARSAIAATRSSVASIDARRIMAGEPVSDSCLYGVRAHELIAEGLHETDLAPYRSWLFLTERKLYGEEEALRKERERKARHEATRPAPEASSEGAML